MSFFDLTLSEMATWVYVLTFVALLLLIYSAHRSGLYKAKEKFMFYTPLTGDLPKGAMYQVRGVLNEEDVTYLILRRVDGMDNNQEPFLLRSSEVDRERLKGFKFGDMLMRNVSGLRKF